MILLQMYNLVHVLQKIGNVFMVFIKMLTLVIVQLRLKDFKLCLMRIKSPQRTAKIFINFLRFIKKQQEVFAKGELILDLTVNHVLKMMNYNKIKMKVMYLWIRKNLLTQMNFFKIYKAKQIKNLLVCYLSLKIFSYIS